MSFLYDKSRKIRVYIVKEIYIILTITNIK